MQSLTYTTNPTRGSRGHDGTLVFDRPRGQDGTLVFDQSRGHDGTLHFTEPKDRYTPSPAQDVGSSILEAWKRTRDRQDWRRPIQPFRWPEYRQTVPAAAFNSGTLERVEAKPSQIQWEKTPVPAPRPGNLFELGARQW